MTERSSVREPVSDNECKSESLREPISVVDYQCVTKPHSAWKQSFGGRPRAGFFFIKMDEMLQAG